MSNPKECLSYCTSYSGLAHNGFLRGFVMMRNLFRKPVEPLLLTITKIRRNLTNHASEAILLAREA
jgi:hypothetical protein